MTFRPYDPANDKDAVHRIWREVGWLDEKHQTDVADAFLEAGRAWVAELRGEPECLVTTALTTLRYLDDDLPFGCVTGVCTSRVARKQGLASRLTARAVAEDAAAGLPLAGLGMFEQGFYNQLGFGTGGYEMWLSFDPALLNVPASARVPRRLTADDWQRVHAARLARRRAHGSCSMPHPVFTRHEMAWTKNGFGLGYCDGAHAELTHHLWCEPQEVETGPYTVKWITWRNRAQLLELLGLLKGLGDQVHCVKIPEPPGVQMQDLLRQPFKQFTMTDRSKHAARIDTYAWWQMRMCDVPACVERTRLPGDSVRFNLRLTDPIEQYLDQGAAWRGVAGDHVVTFGPQSRAEPGTDGGLPVLTASVGAFTRLWLGVLPATGLAVSDELAGPPDLLARLDHVLRLPRPVTDWEFWARPENAGRPGRRQRRGPGT